MPIDPSLALGHEMPETASSWDTDDVILYHLGIGAGAPPTDPGELSYTYEADLKVLPSFGVIPSQAALPAVMAVPGLEFNPMLLLHGEQDLEIHQPLPTRAEAVTTARIAALYDKAKAAVAVLETVTSDAAGDRLATNRWSLFLRGEGGFGGDPGPPAADPAPERAPDFVAEFATLPQQALLYRLNGDRNPLHADPGFAAAAGFDRPILHGLCTYGIACRAVVDTMLGGDPTRVARYRVRFSGVVFPGETIVTSMWKEDGRILLRAATAERGDPVLGNGAIWLR